MSKALRLLNLLTDERKIAIAAIDHRGLLKKMLHPEDPESTTTREISEWKRLMAELYSDKVSALLVDPVYGSSLVGSGGKCGWLLSMEQTGYLGGQEARVTELIPNWSVARAKELGASGVKLLLYYDPENVELAKHQRELAASVAKDAKKEGMVFLLEPLSYKVEGSREQEVLKIAREVSDLDVDIFKFEYPGSREGCLALSTILPKPWVLLSAGVDFDNYQNQLKIACEAGASGMAVGRAAWQEFGQYEPKEREEFLRKVAVNRIEKLTEVVKEYGKSVSEPE